MIKGKTAKDYGFLSKVEKTEICARKSAEEIVNRIWDGKEDGGVDTCVLAQGGECREGVGACRAHVVDKFTDLIAHQFAEGEE